MTLAEKVKNEQDNRAGIFLHREGLFWKAYEYSAYLFVKEIRAYRPQKKEVKSLKTDIVSLGFPDRILGEILDGRDHAAHGEKCIEIKGFSAVEASDYEQWKKNLPAGDSAAAGHGGDLAVLARLRSFRTEAASPLQCLMFISELQKELTHDVR